MFEDKTLKCKECGAEVVVTAGDQGFYAAKCFKTCAACGGEARVPFEPKSDRPVYCSECFAKMREQH